MGCPRSAWDCAIDERRVGVRLTAMPISDTMVAIRGVL